MNCRATNVFEVSKVKEQCRKPRRSMRDIVYFNVFEKIALNPSLVLAPYFPCFE
jgi:hypothetical protein